MGVNKNISYVVDTPGVKKDYSTGDNMKKLILIAALACAFTSVAFANPVDSVSASVVAGAGNTLTGEEVHGFCAPVNFGDIYLGTALGIPSGIFLLGSLVSFIAGARSAGDVLAFPAWLAGITSTAVQIATSIAYKVECGRDTAIN